MQIFVMNLLKRKIEKLYIFIEYFIAPSVFQNENAMNPVITR